MRRRDQGVAPVGPGPRPFGAEPQDASQAEPLVPNAEYATTGWFSADLGRAYFAVERARAEFAQPNGSSIDDAFRDALATIETADCELERAR